MHAPVEKRCCHRRDRDVGGSVRWKRSEKPRIIDCDYDHDHDREHDPAVAAGYLREEQGKRRVVPA